MKALGNNLLVKPREKNKVLKSGVIIPDNASPSGLEWGTVVQTCTDDIDVGVDCIYYGKKCFEEDGIKVVDLSKIIFWYDKQ